MSYRISAGVEATMSELKRGHGMGKLRVRTAAKVRFAVDCKVIACNIKRWAMGEGRCRRSLAFNTPLSVLFALFGQLLWQH